MINLMLGIIMFFVIVLFLWSYTFDPNNALVVSLSKKQVITILIVLGVLMIYLLETGIYQSFL